MASRTAASAANPRRPELFGGRLVAVRVLLEHADPAAVEDLLTQAWRRRAPKNLTRANDDNR